MELLDSFFLTEVDEHLDFSDVQCIVVLEQLLDFFGALICSLSDRLTLVIVIFYG